MVMCLRWEDVVLMSHLNKLVLAFLSILTIMLLNGCDKSQDASSVSHSDNGIYNHKSDPDEDGAYAENTAKPINESDESINLQDTRPDGEILATKNCEYIEEYNGYCLELIYSKDSYIDREWIYDVVFRVRSDEGKIVDGVVRSPAMLAEGGTLPKGSQPQMETLHLSAGDIAVIKIPVLIAENKGYVASFYYFDEDELIELSLNFPNIVGPITADYDTNEISFNEYTYTSSERKWTSERKTYGVDLIDRKMLLK